MTLSLFVSSADMETGTCSVEGPGVYSMVFCTAPFATMVMAPPTAPPGNLAVSAPLSSVTPMKQLSSITVYSTLAPGIGLP